MTKLASNAKSSHYAAVRAIAETTENPLFLLRAIDVASARRDLVIELANRPACALTDQSEENLVGQRLSMVLPFEDNWTQCQRFFRKTRANEADTGDFPLEIEGQTRWFRDRIAMIDEGRMCLQLLDISAERDLQRQLVRSRYLDAVTGLNNRVALGEALEAQLRVAVLAVFRIREFGLINESYGTSVGNELLRQAGQRLANAGQGIAYRVGPDQFALLWHDFGVAAADADTCVRMMHQGLQSSYRINGRPLRCRFLAGYVCRADLPEIPSRELLMLAEYALKQASTSRGTAVVAYGQGLLQTHRESRAVAHHLALRPDHREFYNHYQPQFRLQDNRLCGFEVLSRWRNSQMGLVSPTRYIDVADQLNLLAQLDQDLLRRVGDAVTELPRGDQPHVFSVNASPKSLQDKEYIDLLIDFANTHSELCHLEVEVTENALIADATLMRNHLVHLRDHGVAVVLDDFGAGYSNLGYLASFPFTKLKLDMTLVRDIEIDDRARRLACASIGMAHALGLEVVAEGIETDGQLEVLQEAGCEYGQGYLFSRPLSLESLTQFLGNSPQECE